MRVEPHGVGSILHVIKRGTRGVEIVRDESDRIRFSKALFYLNDEHDVGDWMRDTEALAEFERPHAWPERKPLTQVLAWTLMPNHFHLLLRESTDGGVAKFMQRLGGSMTTHFNAKYGEKGSLFQGGYKAKTIDSDSYLRYLVQYILVKNVFELHPGGLKKAMSEFDRAWERAQRYSFSSLHSCISDKSDLTQDIVDIDSIDSLGLRMSPALFKKRAQEMLETHMTTRSEDFDALLLEQW
ncbi:MAG: transposase [Patescibacteria group bacterium]